MTSRHSRRDDYGSDPRGGRDARDARDGRAPRDRPETRESRDVRDSRATRERDPRDAYDPREQRVDPYSRSRPVMDDRMEYDPDITRSSRLDQPQRGGMDTRMETDEPVMYREYQDPRTGRIVREQVPARTAYREEREPDIRRPTMDIDDPLDDGGRSGGRPRLNDYFLPGDGINREVIQYEICRYLGQDATVRPYSHRDGRSGYMITAYRALTTAMIATLKQDSLKYDQEQRSSRQGRGSQVPYASSNTASYRERQDRTDRVDRIDRSGYRGHQMDVDEDDYGTGRESALSPQGYPGDYGRPQQSSSSRHQIPVTSAGYMAEAPYPQYTVAPSAGPYYETQQPRIFNTTPDPTGRTAQPGYGPTTTYPANTPAPRQTASSGGYIDPRSNQYVPSSSAYPQESGRHATRR